MGRIARVALFVVGTAGCAPGADGEEATLGDSTSVVSQGVYLSGYVSTTDPSITPGLYTTPETGAKVIAVWSNHYCWVIDPGELEAIAIANGWGTNTTRASLSAIARNRPGDANTYCRWPNGMLVRDSAVYLIDNGLSCHITSNAQVDRHGGWSRVWWPRYAARDLRFEFASRYVGDCEW